MSDPGLYVNALMFGLLFIAPWVIFRRLWVEAVFLFLLDFFLISNLMYCRTYLTAIPLDSYSYVSNLSDFTASVTDSFRLTDLLLPLLTGAGLLVARRAKPGSSEGRCRRFALTYCALTGVSVLAAFLTAAFRGGFYSHFDRLKESCYYTTCTASIYTPFGSILYDSMGAKDDMATEEESRRVAQWLEDDERLNPWHPLQYEGETPQNLILIFCESLESWVVGTEVEGRPITPFMNSLVADTTRNFYAPNVVTQVASGRSIDAQLLINAGMLPLRNTVYSMKYPQRVYPTLNQALKERFGSRSYLLTCDKPVVWNQKPIAEAFHIDSLLDRSNWKNDELVGNPPKLSDGSFFRQSVEKMRSGEVWPEGERAFLQFVTYSGHNPFRLPQELKRIDIPASYPERLRDYMTMANYTDHALEQLISYLRTRKDFDRTLIVITGDHEGLASDRASLLQTEEGKRLVNPRQLTPLLILNSPVGGRYDGFVGQIDIYPSLLALMQLDDYYWKGFGRSLFSPEPPRFAISSMTEEVVGDTVGIDAERFLHQSEARDISGLIIRCDLFNKFSHK